MKVYSGTTYIGYICKDGKGYLPHIDFNGECSGLGEFDEKKGAYVLSKTVDEAAKKIENTFKAIAKTIKAPKVGKLSVR